MIDTYYKNKQEIKKYNIVRNILLAVLCLIALFFIFSIYSKTRKVVAPENIIPALNQEFSALAPEMAVASQEVFFAALPAYQRIAKNELFNIDSVLNARVQREKEIFESNLHEVLESEIYAGVERLTANQLDKVSEKLPVLKTPEGRQKVIGKFTVAINQELNLVSSSLTKHFFINVDMIKKSIAGFDTSKFEAYKTEDLQKYFVHLWLMLLDDLIMNPQHEMMRGES